MKFSLKPLILLIAAVSYQHVFCQNAIPYLQKKGDATQLIVDEKPFIILGGELGNSSGSTVEYMQTIWPKVKAMNLNTVLVPVYWELIEKEEGKFDFSMVEQIIQDARKNDLKLVFLWFASWKNSMSCYAPAWIKVNQEKYPRIKDDKNHSQEILTPFSENNLQADLKAFEKLMEFIKTVDGNNHTVIMIQVENEIGMLPSARDYSPQANELFTSNVPAELINYLQSRKDMLVPAVLEKWQKNGFKTSGVWEEIFGKGLGTDEIFMAWYYAKYTNKIVEAGKKIYPLPMFVNAALNRPGREPGSGYPSAGPLPHIIDIWKAGGKSIDFLSPDIYFPNIEHWCDLYVRPGNPLFIPEHRFDNTTAAKALFTIGHYESLGFSPFSIESSQKLGDEPIGKAYKLIAQLTPTFSAQQGQNKIEGVLLDKENPKTILQLGNYEITFSHGYTIGFSDASKDTVWPAVGAIIIQTGENEFYIAGTGVVATFKYIGKESVNVGILSDEEGSFVNEKWNVNLYLNGDQTHQGRHIRISMGEFSIQRVELYTYE